MRTVVASLAMTFTVIAQAQTFNSAADCDQEHKRLTAEATRYDNQWSDCAAGTSHGALYSCSNLSGQQRVASFTALANKRDVFSAQAKNLWPICRQMVNNERDQQRASALARQESQQQQREQQRRLTISTQQYESDRRAEALSAANTANRTDTLNRQAEAERQAAARQRSSNAKAAAGSLAAALTNMLSNNKAEDDSSSEKYSNIQDGVEKAHQAAQREQSELVNRIQKAAWDKIREQNLATLQDSSDVSKAISGFKGDAAQTNPWNSSSGRGARMVAEAPANPWQEAKSASNRLRPVVDGAMKTFDSACDDNPWACDKDDSKKPKKKAVAK